MPSKPKPPTPAEQVAFQLANQFRDHVVARVKIPAGERLWCPRERSDMTPCLARDGELAVAFDSYYGPVSTLDQAICVGCGTRLKFLWDAEQTKT